MSAEKQETITIDLERDVAEQLFRDAQEGATYTAAGYLRLRALNPLGTALGYSVATAPVPGPEPDTDPATAGARLVAAAERARDILGDEIVASEDGEAPSLADVYGDADQALRELEHLAREVREGPKS